jgi:hypothetical protein
LMPHPERASEKILGSDDGLNMFKGMLNEWENFIIFFFFIFIISIISFISFFC